jgi:hypothetical protein
MPSAQHKLIEQLPTVDEYFKLRQAVDWQNLSLAKAKIGLCNSLYSVCLLRNNDVIEHGRVVGDGSLVFYRQCTIEISEYQGHGSRIMNVILAYLKEYVQEGAFIGLMVS